MKREGVIVPASQHGSRTTYKAVGLERLKQYLSEELSIQDLQSFHDFIFAESNKQHKAETYTIPSAKKAPQFELQGDGMELNYLGRAGMNLNVGNNQKVIVDNIKFKADKTGKKPVNITVGKSSEFKANNTTIDNLNNITGKSAAEKGVVTFSPTQLYSGTINANVKATGLNKINKK